MIRSVQNDKPATQTTVKLHQVWREVDPRFTRFARIIGTGQRGAIQIRTVIKAGDDWIFPPHSRPTFCSAKRFNGKRGGYELHQDAPK